MAHSHESRSQSRNTAASTSAGRAEESTAKNNLKACSALLILGWIACIFCGWAVGAIGDVLGGGTEGRSYATVLRVVDGDTVDVEFEGAEERVRLLNVDTPETKHPDLPVQCLGPEATEWLAQRLPEGTRVELTFDEEKRDKYDRLLAGVFESESLINAELAREGLGAPMLVEPNDRFLPEVEAAWGEARSNQRGMFDPQHECTIPSQIQAVEQQLTTVPDDPSLVVEGYGAAELAAQHTLESLDVEDLEKSPHAIMATSFGAEAVREWHTQLTTLKQRAHEKKKTAERSLQKQQVPARKPAPTKSTPTTKPPTSKASEEKSKSERNPKPAPKKKTERVREQATKPKHKKPVQAKPERRHETPKKQSPNRDTPKPTAPRPAPKPKTKRAPKPEQKQTKRPAKKSSSSGCVPYGPVIPYGEDGGYTGKRYGMPGGKGFRKCK